MNEARMALRGTLTHFKTQLLAKKLGIDNMTALGAMEALWHVTAEDAPQGNIGRLSDTAIAMQMYNKSIPPKKMIAALVAAGLLDEDREHRLLVHDWHIHAEYNIKRKLQRQHLCFLTKNGPIDPITGQITRYDASQHVNDRPPYHNHNHNQDQKDSLPTRVGKTEKKSDVSPYVTAWNANCHTLPRVTAFGPTRSRLLNKRIAEGLTLEKFTSAVIKAATTPKCTGENRDGWKVSFDWLIADENNIAKVLEGAYDTTQKKQVKPVTTIGLGFRDHNA